MTEHDPRPVYGPHLWHICDACNYDTHRCHFCGDDLPHTLDTLPTNRVDRHPCYLEWEAGDRD